MTAPSRGGFLSIQKNGEKAGLFPVFGILLPFFIAHAGLSGLDETLAGDMLYLQAEHPDLIHGAVGVPFRTDGGILVADDLRTTDFLLTIFDLFKVPGHHNALVLDGKFFGQHIRFLHRHKMRPGIHGKAIQLVAVARTVEHEALAAFLNRIRQRYAIGLSVRADSGQHAVYRGFQLLRRILADPCAASLS